MVLKKVWLLAYVSVSILIISLSIFANYSNFSGLVVKEVNNSDTCVSNWNCSNWGQCNGTQYRSCMDVNNCNVISSMPILSRECIVPLRDVLTNGIIIWDGESNLSRNWNFKNAQVVNNRVYSGEHSLLITNPTPPFSEGVLDISENDSNLFNLDLSVFNEIRFYVRGDRDDQSFYFKVMGLNSRQESNSVNINNFIDGNSISRSYKLVKIPMAVLRNSQYDLKNVKGFVFSSTDGGLLYVDDIHAIDDSAPVIENLRLNGTDTIQIDLDQPCDINFCLNSSNYVPQGKNFKLNSAFVNYVFNQNISNYQLLSKFNIIINNNENYSLIIKNLTDIYHNSINSSSIYNFTFVNGGAKL